VLADTDAAGPRAATPVLKATRENVQLALADLRKVSRKDDQLLVLLIGHGTSLDGDDAKSSRGGRSERERVAISSSRFRPIVFVDTTGGSFPSATAGRPRPRGADGDRFAAQQFETVFAESSSRRSTIRLPTRQERPGVRVGGFG